MATFGVFQGDDLINGVFVDSDSAEESAAALERLDIHTGLDVRQLCPDHETHGIDDCPDTQLFHRMLECLKR